MVAGAGLGGGALLLAAALAHLVRAPRPLVDLQILRIATFRVTALAGSGYRAAITAIPFLLVLFFQLGFGWSAARAGLVVIALFVGNVGIKPATTTLLRRFGIRPVMLGAALLPLDRVKRRFGRDRVGISAHRHLFARGFG